MLVSSNARDKALLEATASYVETVLQAPLVINGPMAGSKLPA